MSTVGAVVWGSGHCHASLLTMDKILKLPVPERSVLWPSVLATLRAAIKWVCARLAIDVPNFEVHQFQALQAKVMSDRARTLKEAIPFLIEVVCELEGFAVNGDKPQAARVFIWWILYI